MPLRQRDRRRRTRAGALLTGQRPTSAPLIKVCSGLFLTILLAAAPLVTAEVYKWVDERGRVHYGDRPPAHAQRADLPPIQVVDPGLPKATDGAAAPVSAVEKLAQCLAQRGVTLYGASWCGQCKRQLKMFGAAARQIPYVECSLDRKKEQAAACTAQGIEGYPTWVFPDGQRRAGVRSAQQLAASSGCA